MKHSIVVKLAISAALIIMFLYPLSMVQSIIHERGEFRDVASSQVRTSWTGPQTLAGPFLSIGYRYATGFITRDNVTQNYLDTGQATREDRLLLRPETLHIESFPEVTYRSKGIYRIPVYTTKFILKGTFDTSGLRQRLQQPERFLSWDQASLHLNISDNRGLEALPDIVVNGETRSTLTGTGLDNKLAGLHTQPEPFVSADTYRFNLSFTLRGMETIRIVPIGDQTEVTMASDWPHPAFGGRYLPSEHEIGPEGFKANWKLTQLATGIAEFKLPCYGTQCSQFLDNSLEVGFLEAVDGYQQSLRAVKYGLLTILLVFTAFFLFEIVGRRPIHPFQYLVVGASLSLFYLLLVSLSEFLSFGVAYAVSTTAAIGAIGYYLRYVLASGSAAARFSVALAGLYGMVYTTIQAEDFALLMGSLLLFAALVAVMVSTRNVDWYALEDRFRLESTQRKAQVSRGAEVESPA